MVDSPLSDSSGTSGGRVALVTAGDGGDWSIVRGQLVTLGWRVQLVEVSALDPSEDAERLLPPLDGLDAAVVVLSRARRRTDLGDERQLAQTAQLVGLLRGRLGSSRVLVLTEQDQVGLIGGPDGGEVGYQPQAVETQFPRLRLMLSEARPPDSGRAGFGASRVGFALGSLAPELWLVLGPLLVLVAVLAVSGLVVMNWRSGDPGTRLTSVDLDPAILAPATTLAPVAGPAAELGGSGSDGLQLLPTRCVIPTDHGTTLPAIIECDGTGVLVPDGFPGPWHTEIGTIALDPGAIGTVVFEARSGATDPPSVDLAAGTEQSLDRRDASYGVDRVEMIFGADGQQVVFRQIPTSGARQVVFTFRLSVTAGG